MMEAAVLGTDQDPSLGHYLKEWLHHARGRVRATTHQGYDGVIRLYALPALGDVALKELSPLHLQRLYGSLLDPERHLSGGTVLNLHLVLTQALGTGREVGDPAGEPGHWGPASPPPAPRAGGGGPRPGLPDRGFTAG